MRPFVPKLAPAALSTIDGYTVVAWNVYQTSGVSTPHAVVIDGLLNVALLSVPVTAAGFIPGTRVVALAQRSLGDELITAIEKPQFTLVGVVLILANRI